MPISVRADHGESLLGACGRDVPDPRLVVRSTQGLPVCPSSHVGQEHYLSGLPALCAMDGGQPDAIQVALTASQRVR